MERRPNYFVISSPYDQEDADYPTCFIVLQIPDRKIMEFCDYIDKNTVLSADGFSRLTNFYTSIGNYLVCNVVEVHIKEGTPKSELSCEEIAEAETRKYLQENGYPVDNPW